MKYQVPNRPPIFLGVATVVLTEFLYRGDAEIARAALSSVGIPAIVKAEDEGGLNPGFYSEYRVALLVTEADAHDAREVLGIDQPLVVPPQIREAMMAHSRWAYPNEACGLIVGNGSRLEMVFCLTNRLASPSRYTIDPREHYGAAQFAEGRGLSILGAWHSHPNGDATMSPTDIAESPGGAWVSLIVGNFGKPSEAVRAFRTKDGRPIELEVITRPTA